MKNNTVYLFIHTYILTSIFIYSVYAKFMPSCCEYPQRDPESSGPPGVRSAVGNHGSGRVPPLLLVMMYMKLAMGTNTLKCWGVRASGTTSERPRRVYSRRATACLQARWLLELKSSSALAVEVDGPTVAPRNDSPKGPQKE